MRWLLFLPLLGCSSDFALLPMAVEDTGLLDVPADLAEPSEPDEALPPGCIGWEDGSLDAAGYTGRKIELTDGALVLVVREGDDWSALEGEEAIELRGERALVLRSSHDGRVDSVAVATTPVFDVDPDAPGQLSWWQLSEVDDRGIALTADILDEDDTILTSLDLPVRTGGFLPALKPEHEPVDGFPEIIEDIGSAGVLVRQTLDLSPFGGLSIRLRLFQHTLVERNGFFTVLDDICLGPSPGAVAAGGPARPGRAIR